MSKHDIPNAFAENENRRIVVFLRNASLYIAPPTKISSYKLRWTSDSINNPHISYNKLAPDFNLMSDCEITRCQLCLWTDVQELEDICGLLRSWECVVYVQK